MGGREETDARSFSHAHTHTHTAPSLHLLSLRRFSGERVKVKAEGRVMKWWAILFYLNFLPLLSQFLPIYAFQNWPRRERNDIFFLPHPYKLINTINILTLVKESSIHAVSSLFHPCTVLYAWVMRVVSFWVISNQGALVCGPLSSLMLSLWMHEVYFVMHCGLSVTVFCYLPVSEDFVPAETINRAEWFLMHAPCRRSCILMLSVRYHSRNTLATVVVMNFTAPESDPLSGLQWSSLTS